MEDVEDSTLEIERLKGEVERLKRQLGPSKPRDFAFLGETIPGEMLAELTSRGSLTARGTATRTQGMYGDGGNLWLQITAGGRSWLFRYRQGSRQREMGLGSLRVVPLAEARARAAICRRLLRQGVDPIDRRRALLPAETRPTRTTFREAGQHFFESKKDGWRSDKHAIQFPNTMRDYVYPHLGDVPVQDVDTECVLRVLEQEVKDGGGKVIGRFWTSRAETASRVRARIEQVLDWAAARQLRQGDNPARWRGHLSALLPERKKVRSVKHHPALPYAEIHAFWLDLAKRSSTSAEALRFAILTAARTGEVVGARWNEIDVESGVWTVPAERMKAHRQHRVPLSDEAAAALERMKALEKADDGFVFPGSGASTGLSNMALTMLLRKMKRSDLTVHGFRSTFRDWAAEVTTHPNEMVEMALAHTVGNKVEAAYRRGDMFARRRGLMNDWATYCTSPLQPPAAV
jgi:integrase